MVNEEDAKAAYYILHSSQPKIFKLDSKKHHEELAASEYIEFILESLKNSFDKKRRPSYAILYDLFRLKAVSEELKEASKYNPKIDGDLQQYKKHRDNAENTLLNCFGLGKRNNQLTKDESNMVHSMAKLLCPPLDENDEMDGEPECQSVQAAAKIVVNEFNTKLSYKTVERAWKKFKGDHFK